MEHASEFVYVYDHSDSEEIEFDDDETEEELSSTTAAVSIRDSSPASSNQSPRRRKSFLSSVRSSFKSLIGLRSARKSRDRDSEPGLNKTRSSPSNESKKLPHTASSLFRTRTPPHPLALKKRVRKADTNIAAFKFSKLLDPSHIQVGEPTTCGQCEAHLSHLSRLKKAGKEKTWRCEFCDYTNVGKYQKPEDDDITYVLETAPAMKENAVLGFDESVLVFCVDVSSSMCSTVQEPDGTYVSRLEGVKMAIDQQLTRLSREYPRRRVCLVTFESNVQVLGDCSTTPTTLSCNYEDAEAVMHETSKLNCLHPVSEAVNTIREAVRHLHPQGSTALGPGLAAALSIAIQTRGSQVIMCTDGLANLGVGSLEGKDQIRAAEPFYADMKNLAKRNGVSISVIAIEGSYCRLGQLGVLADATGGKVNIVDPLQLRDEFGNILDNLILATNVHATMYLNPGLYVRHESTVTNIVTRDIGAVTAIQEITFEYGVDRGQTDDVALSDGGYESANEKREGGKSGKTKTQNPVDGREWLPFQFQLCYLAADGSKVMRVFTQRRHVTRDRTQAEESVDIRVVATHAVQHTGRLAEQGRYSSSHLYNMGMSKSLEKWKHDCPAKHQLVCSYQSRSQGLLRSIPSSKYSSTSLSSWAECPPLAIGSDAAANAVYDAKRVSFY